MNKSLGTLLHLWGVFQFTHAQPLPSPHKQHWTLVSRIFSEFQLSIVWGRGELQENFERDLLFYGGIQNLQKIMNTALLSQGLLSMIVVVTKYVMYSPLVSIFEPQCKPVVLPVICVNSWMFNLLFSHLFIEVFQHKNNYYALMVFKAIFQSLQYTAKLFLLFNLTCLPCT